MATRPQSPALCVDVSRHRSGLATLVRLVVTSSRYLVETGIACRVVDTINLSALRGAMKAALVAGGDWKPTRLCVRRNRSSLRLHTEAVDALHLRASTIQSHGNARRLRYRLVVGTSCRHFNSQQTFAANCR